MKIIFALALGLGAVLPLASPVSAQTSSTRLARRQSLARLFPQLGIRPNREITRVGTPKNVVTSALRRTTAAVPAPSATMLSFEFFGFPSNQKAELEGFINANYNTIVQVWGPPAPEQRGKTVTVTNVDNAAIYAPSANGANGGYIDFDYINTGVPNENSFRLLKLVLSAFQGPRVPAVDFFRGHYLEPYSLGASEAAALQIFYKVLGSPADFDPGQYADYYLPFYDAFNSPALCNIKIVSESEDVTIADFRLAMAQAAFLKLYTEKETFFADFNAALYTSGAARRTVNADELEAIGASVCPTVEGQPFRVWVHEQGALNARVQTGNKLYLVALPSVASASTGNRSSAVIFAEAFATNADGDDVALFSGAPKTSNGTLLPAYAAIDAYDETGRNINSYSTELKTSNVLIFNDRVAPGEARLEPGFVAWNTPAAARVTFRARLGTAEGTAVFPFGAAGTSTAPAKIYGATLGGTTGTIAITSGTQSQNIPISRGTFSAIIDTVSGPRVKTTLSDGSKTFLRNTAWLRPNTLTKPLEFLLSGAGAAVSSSTLSLNTANGRLKMIAFPLRPVERDEARALNLPANSLSLARYRPDLSPPGYQTYPNISQGPEAGFGYWLQIPTTGLNTQVAGTFAPTNLPAELELKGGWNQVGVPRATAVSALNVKVRYGGYSAVTLQDAQTRGWLGAGVWRYNGTSGYERVDVSGGTLKPWEGYWVFASPQTGVSLVFEPTTTTQSVRALAAASGSWSVTLAAASSSSRDTSASFGVSTAKPAAKPPVATRQLSVYFAPRDAAASSGGGTAQGFLQKLGAKNEWVFTVDGATKGEQVTLSWPNFANAPTTLQLQLRDNTTGRFYNMKSGGKVVYSATGTAQTFTILGTPVSASATSAKGS